MQRKFWICIPILLSFGVVSAIPYLKSDKGKGKLEEGTPPARSFDWNAEPQTLDVPKIKLFGHVLTPGHWEPPDATPPHPQSVGSSTQPDKLWEQSLTTSSPEPLGWQVGFPHGRLPELDGNTARYLNINFLRGQTEPVPAYKFNTAAMFTLSHLSSVQLSHRGAETYYYPRMDEHRQIPGLFARPIHPTDFSKMFPSIPLDAENTIPIVVYRIKLGQPQFQTRSKIDIMAVELVRLTSPNRLKEASSAKMYLRSILRFVEAGVW